MLGIETLIKNTAKMKLLYVEDNEDARESTLSILGEFFKEIKVAVDGEEGLKLFKTSEIDLIITDINMPKLNGIDMITEIRKIDKDVSILVLSAYNESGFFVDSIRLNVDGYLLKPIEAEQFIEILDTVSQKNSLKEKVKEKNHLMLQYQEATDESSIVSKTDLSGKITYVNDEFCEISGYTKQELIGKNHNCVRHPDMPSSAFKDMWNTIKIKKKTWHGIVKNLAKDGSSYYVKAVVKPITDSKGNVVEYISLRDDITNIMNPKKQLQDLVNSCDESIVIVLKIESFEDIEKYYAENTAEKIEDEFSKVLVELMPDECDFERVFTLGGGKYAFAKDNRNCTIGIDNVVKRLKEFQQAINEYKIDIGDFNYDISIVVSVAFGSNALKNANYGLKEILNINQDFIVADNLAEKEYSKAQNNLETLKIIKQALDNFKIVSHFQPIVNNKTKNIEKYESLVRLVDSNGNILSPFSFLDIAKKAKYYSQITLMILENSFNALDNTEMDISINISVLDIEKRLTREKIFELLKANSDKLHRVIFELLEDESAKDFTLIKSFINDVKSMGVRIAIDDFGAGYSNFERLLDYQPDILKIDGSLIKDILSNKFSLNVVETIVSFAKKQDILTIAEYVESENIFNILNEIGVDYSQGYYFGKPQELIKYK